MKVCLYSNKNLLKFTAKLMSFTLRNLRGVSKAHERFCTFHNKAIFIKIKIYQSQS